ncbi:hypothetical protein POM88_010420 [Heracleum sosnowskyi]|nr:hypothetical protein POM88_010420 [Heracleum sosnowskyi]
MEEPFPDVLRQLHHKEYLVTVVLTEDNIHNGSTVYEAVEVDNAIEISDDFSPGKNDMVNQQDLSLINDKQIPILLEDTPQTGKSTNWKRRARKNTAPILYDNNENGPTKDYKAKALPSLGQTRSLFWLCI